jgi:multiple sugar transport system substrate-binding protein
MTRRIDQSIGGAPYRLSRRSALKGAAFVGGTAIAAPWIASSRARAQNVDLGPYEQANIDWRQAEGESIVVAVISATYFDKLLALMPAFKQLSGIDVQFQKIHPRELRQKAILDLSAGTGNLASSATDPMYYALYVTNGWVDPLDDYLGDSSLTDPAWFDLEDVIPAWREAASMDGQLYGMPFDGEATIQFYRKDIYDQHGIAPAETLEDYEKNAAAIHDPDNRLWGAALRGFAGPGQNMYIYPSIFRAYGGEWFDQAGNLNWNTPEALGALEWYVHLLKTYAPPGVENWNWPDLGDAYSQGTIGSYIDGHNQAYLFTNPERSQVVGKVAYARWPTGPSGKRVTSIWNWGFPINAALSDSAKVATWLFIQFACCKQTQILTSYQSESGGERYGVNRNSLWSTPEFRQIMDEAGDNFIDAVVESMQEDTDPNWRPRVQQWPAVGDTMAVAVQAALVGQMTPKDALATSQAKIDQIMGQ